jgi:hypothetical protein
MTPKVRLLTHSLPVYAFADEELGTAVGAEKWQRRLKLLW